MGTVVSERVQFNEPLSTTFPAFLSGLICGTYGHSEPSFSQELGFEQPRGIWAGGGGWSLSLV